MRMAIFDDADSSWSMLRVTLAMAGMDALIRDDYIISCYYDIYQLLSQIPFGDDPQRLAMFAPHKQTGPTYQKRPYRLPRYAHCRLGPSPNVQQRCCDCIVSSRVLFRLLAARFLLLLLLSHSLLLVFKPWWQVYRAFARVLEDAGVSEMQIHCFCCAERQDGRGGEENRLLRRERHFGWWCKARRSGTMVCCLLEVIEVAFLVIENLM